MTDAWGDDCCEICNDPCDENDLIDLDQDGTMACPKCVAIAVEGVQIEISEVI